MKLLLILALSFLSFAAKVNFEEMIKPSQFENINWTQEQNIEKYQDALGDFSLKKDNKFYYEVNGLKYPISLHKKKDSNELEKIYFRVLDGSITFNTLKEYLKTNNFKEVEQNDSDYKVFKSEKRKMKFKFSAITQKLYSVEKWF